MTANETQLYLLAILNFVFLVIWWILNSFYERRQSAAHAARRASMISNGLGQEFSASETRRLTEKMNVDKDAAAKLERSDYYSSTKEPGPHRLVELVQESAFYSSRLHTSSGQTITILIGIILVIYACIAALAVPQSTNYALMLLVRMFFAATLFILSADVLGARNKHLACAKITNEILLRSEMLLEVDPIPEIDALLLMEDYTSAIERAPEIVPKLYGIKRDRLNDLWSEYTDGKKKGALA
ncbi:hypothetical protein [Pseudoruegeria sp. HB172150]|uniref:hypothetical protein n=1 Tax=Pseudoruegeria sp. HB172150 TaxID=2721164 RepID=UPI001C12FB85|nr:hypothetical protein [Pseudoruegeria sp. HB172150]